MRISEKYALCHFLDFLGCNKRNSCCVSVFRSNDLLCGPSENILVPLVDRVVVKLSCSCDLSLEVHVLLHGVGDAKAFAGVYAAMCRDAGLDCYVVAGMKGGKLWYWNIVNIDGNHYHVDMLRSKTEGALRLLTDNIINEGYVWDFSAYPTCGSRSTQ